jgi:hypothetical protein
LLRRMGGAPLPPLEGPADAEKTEADVAVGLLGRCPATS